MIKNATFPKACIFWGSRLFWLCFALATLMYIIPVIPDSQRSVFAYHISDALFLSLLLVIVIGHYSSTRLEIARLFWMFIAGSILSWLSLPVIASFVWDNLNSIERTVLSSVCYFLFYALFIAGIEVSRYSKASELLSQHSLLIWFSTLTFSLGAFIYLIIAPLSSFQLNNNGWPTPFLFFMVMDIYLLARCFHLFLTSSKSVRTGFLFLSLAFLSWFVSDLIETLTLTNIIDSSPGSFLDWFSYLPYVFIVLGLNTLDTSGDHQSFKLSSRMHLLNSPVFFVLLILALFAISTHSGWFNENISATQYPTLMVWISCSLLLAVVQLVLLLKQTSHLREKVKGVIDERDSLEQHLQQQNAHIQQQSATYRSILETTSNAIFTVDENGTIQTGNPAACKMLDIDEHHLIGSSIADYVKDGEELSLYFSYSSYKSQLQRSEAGVELEATVTTTKGKDLLVHATLSQGRMQGKDTIVVSLADISQQKRAEEEVLRLKDQFTANISHEFRTPLTIINGVLDNLVTSPKLLQEREQIKSAKKNTLRMVRMVEQLLELSRANFQSLPINDIDASETTSFVTDSFSSIAREKNIVLHSEVSAGCWIKGNLQALEKIVFNILSNALKYTPNNGRVSVTLIERESDHELTITDTGVGIPEHELPKIFERFYRTQSSNALQTHGVGIGLALVKELCDALNWQIHVSSEESKGTTFTINMPKSQPSHIVALPDKKSDTVLAAINKNVEAELIDAQHTTTSSENKSKFLVLIVEDNQEMQAHINQTLSPYHQCLTANNGEEGIKLALDCVPDIIVTDLMMPGIDGYDLVKILRRNELTAHIPIIMLTAKSDNESKLAGLEAEADDYLTKPFDSQELVLRVNNQIQSREKLQQKLNRQWQQKFQQNEPTKPVSRTVENDFIEKLNEKFEQQFANADLSMSFLAGELAMSERQLQRKVKALLGVSPLEALRQFRLEKARELLKNNQQVGLVAQACGFSSQSHFGRCFKEHFGMTPKAFQKH